MFRAGSSPLGATMSSTTIPTTGTDLTYLLRAYAALLPTKHISFPQEYGFATIHNFLLNKVLLDPHLSAYPPASAYQHSFWKWAISKLEKLLNETEEDAEVDPQIYDAYISSMSTYGSSADAPSPSYVTHYWTDQDGIDFDYCSRTTLLESRKTIEGGTTGLTTWTAARVLSQYIISHHELVATKSILELGCGTGFLGIITATVQLRRKESQTEYPRIYLTDISEEVLKRCRDNISLPCNASSAHSSIHYQILPWGDNAKPIPDADVILGADIVFDPSLIQPLVDTLRSALDKEHKVALVALTLRNESTMNKFVQIANSALDVQDVRDSAQKPMFIGTDDHTSLVRLFRLGAKSTKIQSV